MFNKTRLTYSTYTTASHGYTQTHVVIREMYEEDTLKHLEDTVDNKAGYTTMAYAEAAGRRYQAMLDMGHEVHYSTSTYGLEIHLRWQHYELEADGTQTYCDAAYDSLGRTFGQIEEGMRFLRKIGRAIEKTKATRRNQEATFKSDVRAVSSHTFDRPEDMLAALARMKKSAQVQLDRSTEAWVLTEAKVVPKAA